MIVARKKGENMKVEKVLMLVLASDGNVGN